MREFSLFMWQLLRHPKRTSAIAPSSKGLARQMVSEITKDTGKVVEIGAGTGVFSRAILAAGVAPKDLTIVEMNPGFCNALKTQFPDCNVLEMDAQALGELQLENVNMVISGLPLLSIPEPVQHNIIKGAFDLMQPGGKYVQFTYGPKPPIAPEVREANGLKWCTLKKVWLNLPPAMPYVFTQK
ncbi:MAG: methyltransferase domain-containing protein [Rhodobacteraceae bacterium]|nr:methyltransferase domain-containing protein [Paracoccaceae bacterium]